MELFQDLIHNVKMKSALYLHISPSLNSKTIYVGYLRHPFHITPTHSMSQLDSTDALFYRYEQAQRSLVSCPSSGPHGQKVRIILH